MNRTSAPPEPPLPAVEGLTLSELLTLLRAEWITLAGFAAAAALLCGLYLLAATPVFEASALLQVEPRQATQARSALEAKVEGVSGGDTFLQGEQEILQSTDILRRVVEAMALDIVAEPKSSLPLVGRFQSVQARVELQAFAVPDAARGLKFSLRLEEDGSLTLRDPDGADLTRGKPGTDLQGTWQGQPVKAKVARVTGKPGQVFTLARVPLLEAVERLRLGLTVQEKGKESHLLSLTYMDPIPARGAEILNTLLDQYTRQDSDRRVQDASRALAMLQEEIAHLQGYQSKAEQEMSRSRGGARTLDLGEEARVLIQRSADLDREMTALRQKREELLRTYTPKADVVITLDQQLATLGEERASLERRSASLPQAQQDVIRLQREAQVRQDRYASMRNLEALAHQQLRLAMAGEVGKSRVLDRALPPIKPVRPRKGLVLGIGTLLGLALGIGYVVVRCTMKRPGVEDPHLLETHFNLPVLAIVPHSRNQESLIKVSRRNGDVPPALAVQYPSDLAVEGLRSLRTGLHFALSDGKNKAIMVTGPSPEVGKSFVSVNFALVLAQYGARVLLVDADLRKGMLHRFFHDKGRRRGLSEVLTGAMTWQEAVHAAHGVDLISTGSLPPNASKLLLSERFPAFLEEAGKIYDFIIVDTPPVLAVTDAAIVGAHMGATLMLVKDGEHPLGEIRAALKSLDNAGVKPDGFIFNDIDPESVRQGYRRYAYYYEYEH